MSTEGEGGEVTRETTSEMERNVRASDELKRIKALLKRAIEEEERTLNDVKRAYESVNTAAQALIGSLLSVTNVLMAESKGSKELSEAVGNLASNFAVYNQVLKSVNTTTQNAIEVQIKNWKTIKENLSGTNATIEALKGYETQLGNVQKALQATRTIVFGLTDIMYGFAEQELAVYDAQIRELQAQRTLAQARTMYNIIVKTYGERSEQAQRALKALHYVELQQKVALMDITKAQWNFNLAWLETPVKVAMGVMQLLIALVALNAITTAANTASTALASVGAAAGTAGGAAAGLGGILGGIGGALSGIGGAIGAAIPVIAILGAAFFGLGLAMENVYGGYEGLVKHNKDLVDSFDGLAKDIGNTIQGFMEWAKTLPTGLREIALGLGVFATSIVGIFDRISKALSPLFNLFDGLKNFVVNSFDAMINSIGKNTEDLEKNKENIVKSLKEIDKAASDIGKALGLMPLTEVETYPLFPRRQVGGEIERGGLYYLHPGEIVTRRGMEGNRITNVSPTITMNMTFNVTGDVDLVRIREEIEKAINDAIQKGLYNRGVFFSIG